MKFILMIFSLAVHCMFVYFLLKFNMMHSVASLASSTSTLLMWPNISEMMHLQLVEQVY